ncbi:ATP-binding cassette sub-family g member 5 [Plakobranchus ocellatus]|uniref:ATP-binding cassette sub-family g member 5 n=1 Tax=Plakobranchus ocellatus TaxID=259542 RepID=A0AAV4ATK9_9GAST|nr:ATP-binding cassette sub-family g member 5 [Plakobranchus ocellatus]
MSCSLLAAPVLRHLAWRRKEKQQLLSIHTSPLSDYTSPLVHSHYGGIDNCHRSLHNRDGNGHILSRADTPLNGFTLGETRSKVNSRPLSNGVHHQNGALKVTDLDEAPPMIRSSFVPAEKDAPQPTACLSVVGLTYTVKERPGHWWNGNFLRRAKPKQVLHNLCMTFNKGELTALVGSSGSGKTSLLDVIAGRAEGQVDGVVSYKHEQCTRTMMRQKASYVLQADRLLSTLTVRETLTYMALMKLPGNMTAKEIDKKVQTVIEDMGLRQVSDNRIGGTMIRGVSGGEKRRITIGVQLLKDPEILLLDEPTSGLDSFTARHLVSTLASLAHKGDKLVLLSIHQPRSEIFNMFDRIGILTTGQLAYLGPPSLMVPYFTDIGHPCPRNENPCDFYMDISSVDRRTAESERSTLRKAQSLCNAFSKSVLQESMIDKITSGLNYHYDDERDPSQPQQNQSPSLLRVFLCVLERMNLHLWRDRSNLVGRLLQLPFFVPFMIIFIGRLGFTMGSIQDRLGILYQGTQAPPYIGLTNAVATCEFI